jgi:hypothetical protein
LNISQGDASIESCRYECVPERVRPDGLADTGAASDPSDNPGGTVTVQPPAIVGGHEDQPVTAFTAGQVDRPRRARRQRDGHDLAVFAGDAWPRLPVHVLLAELVDGQKCFRRDRVQAAGGCCCLVDQAAVWDGVASILDCSKRCQAPGGALISVGTVAWAQGR